MAKEKSALERMADMHAQMELLKGQARAEFFAALNALRSQLDELNKTGQQLRLPRYIIGPEGELARTSGKPLPTLSGAQMRQGRKLIKAAGEYGIAPRELGKQTHAVITARDWVAVLGDEFATNGKRAGACRIVAR